MKFVERTYRRSFARSSRAENVEARSPQGLSGVHSILQQRSAKPFWETLNSRIRRGMGNVWFFNFYFRPYIERRRVFVLWIYRFCILFSSFRRRLFRNAWSNRSRKISLHAPTEWSLTRDQSFIRNHSPYIYRFSMQLENILGAHCFIVSLVTFIFHWSSFATIVLHSSSISGIPYNAAKLSVKSFENVCCCFIFCENCSITLAARTLLESQE